MRKYALFILLILLVACGDANQAQNRVDAIRFDSLIHAMPDAQVLDVRTAGEFSGGYIGNAVNMDYNADDFDKQILQLDKSKPVLVYCLSGGRSHSAAGLLRKQGYSVTELEGGIASWKSLNLPVSGVNMAGKSSMDRVAFMSTLENNKLHLVDFNAKWCLPCRKLLPVVDSLETVYQGKIQLHKMDYDQYEKLAREFQVEGIPYVMLILNGEVVWSHFGLPKTEDLEAAIQQNLH
ncbi:MAG: thioredoxin 1 [Bacteroidetes bacterium]|nr:thioredoxin 1 [Bacteroidota bacterium]